MSEILGVLFKYMLALVAVVAVVAILYVAMDGSKISTAAADLDQMQQNIYQLYDGASANAAPITETNLVSVGVVPPSMVSGGQIYDPWGNAAGNLTLPQGGVWANTVAYLAFTRVPLSDCIRLALAASNSNIVTRITNSGNYYVFPVVNYGPQNASNPMTDATNGCQTQAGSSTVEMIFGFFANENAAANAQ